MKPAPEKCICGDPYCPPSLHFRHKQYFGGEKVTLHDPAKVKESRNRLSLQYLQRRYQVDAGHALMLQDDMIALLYPGGNQASTQSSGSHRGSDSAEKQTHELPAEPQTPEPEKCGICETEKATHEVEFTDYTGPVCDTCHPPASSSARPGSQTVEMATVEVLARMNGGYGTAARRFDEASVAALILAVRQEQADARPARTLRRCGMCHTWNSKPCGDLCGWSPDDPAFAPAPLTRYKTGGYGAMVEDENGQYVRFDKEGKP